MPETNFQSTPVRAFIAVPVDAHVINQIAELQQVLREKLSPDSVRWVRPEQLHLTLRFFGNIPSNRLPDIEAATRTACAATAEFELAAQGVACFPDTRAPRVVWVGISGGEQMVQLQRAVIVHTRAFGAPPEERPFRPHLTIGRIKQPRRELNELLAARAANWVQKT